MWHSPEIDQASRVIWTTVALHESRALIAALERSQTPLALESISQIVTAAEIATTECLMIVVQRVIGEAPDPVGPIARDSARKGAEGTWHSRQRVAKQWLGQDWSRNEWFPAWLGFVVARNAWAHGHGVLTRRQLSDSNLDTQLKAAGLVRSGIALNVDGGSVRQCAVVAHDLLRLLDGAVATSARL